MVLLVSDISFEFLLSLPLHSDLQLLPLDSCLFIFLSNLFPLSGIHQGRASMSNLLSKLTDQLSNQNKPQGGQQSPSSGIPHKVNDAMTGQKHPQDYQTQTNTSFAGGEYGGMGGAGYQQSGHLGILILLKQAIFVESVG